MTRALHPRSSRSARALECRAPRRATATPLAAVALAVLVALASSVAPAAARIIPIPASFRVGQPQGGTGNGLSVRFKDVGSGCNIALIKSATDTVTVQVTNMANINFLLNQGCTFGPFGHGCGYFETRWDSYLDIRAAGDYVFSMQVDDQAVVSVGDSTILFLEGGHWFQNVTSDTVRFAYPGSYPLRAYYADCQPCCRGFRLGGMGPAGSGMMAWTPGFNFNSDLGPCCTYGTNGPGVSVIPGALFFRSPPAVAVEPDSPSSGRGALMRCWASPNPARGVTVLAVELARAQRVWAEVYDAAGRLVATLSDGARQERGVVRWPWSPDGARPGGRASGAYFYRVRTEDGSSVSGCVVMAR